MGERCPENLPRAVINGILYPAVQCTKLADTEHNHDWFWAEEERWQGESR